MAHWELRATVCARFLAYVSAVRKHEENEKCARSRGASRRKEKERRRSGRERVGGKRKSRGDMRVSKDVVR